MEELEIHPDATTFGIVTHHFLQTGNYELALQWFISTSKRGLVPTYETAQDMVMAAAKNGQPRLAMDLIQWYESQTVRRIDKEVWTSCLIASAEALFVSFITKPLFCRLTTPLGGRGRESLEHGCAPAWSIPRRRAIYRCS
jgi:hypothetical protein